jgi:L-threonylcarbamoyladenylate synthase
VRRLVISPAVVETDAIAAAVDVLHRGGIVAYPTDTLYGLAVDPRQDAAVDRLFEAKGRGSQMAIPLIAADLDQAQAAGVFGASELKLAALWPAPVSIVVMARPVVARGVLGGGTTAAIRVPAHAIARALASAHGFCITATSANISGDTAAATADEVASALRGRVDLLLDGGHAPGGLPSTVVEMRAGVPVRLRAGAIAWDRVIKSLQ